MYLKLYYVEKIKSLVRQTLVSVPIYRLKIGKLHKNWDKFRLSKKFGSKDKQKLYSNSLEISNKNFFYVLFKYMHIIIYIQIHYQCKRSDVYYGYLTYFILPF